MTYNHAKAVKRFNDIMCYTCCEHLCITETDHVNWNIRDMVAECDYVLSCYYETENCRYYERTESKDCYKRWLSETGKLKRFIATYKPFIKDVRCTERHCSEYDNRQEK